MSCSSTGSHEDHDERCTDRASGHAVHVDGRLRRPTIGATLGVVESDRGLISGRQAYHATRRRELYATGGSESHEKSRRERELVP